MTAPIKTCDYCGTTGEMPTFMNGEPICYTCLSVLPKTLPEARQELMRLRAVLAVVAQPTPSVPDGWKLMPIEPTKEIYECFTAYDGSSYSNPFDFDDFSVDYGFALEAAPEAKP